MLGIGLGGSARDRRRLGARAIGRSSIQYLRGVKSILCVFT